MSSEADRLARRLVRRDAIENERIVLQAIGSCEMATRAAVRREAYQLGRGQVDYALAKLVGEGVLQRREHPEDARKCVYELADDLTMTEVSD